MSSPTLDSHATLRLPPSSHSFNRDLRTALARLAWCAMLALAIYYVWRNVGRYLEVSPDSYRYLWPKRMWLWLHLGGGTLAVLSGPFQFVARLRRTYPRVHRWTGRLYLAGLLVASAGASVMVVTTPLGWTTAYAFVVMIGAWLATALMGWLAIRRRQIEVHRAWMRRNYIITFAFVSFRLVTGHVPGIQQLGTIMEVFTTFGWMSWVVPLLLSEVWVSAWQLYGHPTPAPAVDLKQSP